MLQKTLKTGLKRGIRGLGFEVRRLSADEMHQPGGRVVHFLHIGKNAGTQLARYADQINSQDLGIHIMPHNHQYFLRHVPEGEEYFFSIRNPMSRFRSGFYSRKRKGQPLYYNEWTPHEAVAFATFEHANDLAEALFEEGILGRQAFAAIKSIGHTSQNQVDWFARAGDIFETQRPVAIIRQEKFDTDFQVFCEALGIPPGRLSKGDGTRAHKNDYAAIPPLSDKAIANLQEWYRQDFEFYRQCEAWIEGRF